MASFIEKRFQKPRSLTPKEKERAHSILTEELEKRPEILFAYVHGSFVKGDAARDVDVGIYTLGPMGMEYEQDLAYDLSARVGMDVDLKGLNDAPLPFQMAVVRDGRLLFSRDDRRRTDFIEEVSRRYPEYAHFRNAFLGIDGLRSE